MMMLVLYTKITSKKLRLNTNSIIVFDMKPQNFTNIRPSSLDRMELTNHKRKVQKIISWGIAFFF